MDVSDAHSHRIYNILHGLSLLTTSYLLAEHKKNTGLGRGFVTIPAVEQHYGQARRDSGALVVAYLPTVWPSELETWNQYSTENQGWIEESHSTGTVSDSIFESIWKTASAEIESSCDVPGIQHRKTMPQDQITDRVPVSPDSVVFSPMWTFSPPPDADDVSLVNLDFQMQPAMKKAFDYVSATKEGAYLNACNFGTWFGKDDDGDDVQGVLVYPVFDGHDSATSDVVGHLIAIIPLSVFLRDVIRHDYPSIHVVVENTCDDTLTYELREQHATFWPDKTFTTVHLMIWRSQISSLMPTQPYFTTFQTEM